MSQSWYQCKKCKSTITKDGTPNSPGCPGGSFHEWHKLAEVGNTNYQCRKCNTTIQAKSNPTSPGCPGGSFHEWRKL